MIAKAASVDWAIPDLLLLIPAYNTLDVRAQRRELMYTAFVVPV